MKKRIDIIVIECSSCGAVHNSGGGERPLGWSEIPAKGLTWCDDCTALGIPARQIQSGQVRTGRGRTGRRIAA